MAFGQQPGQTNNPPSVLAVPPARDKFKIYLLMGQSNKAGRDTRSLASQVDNPRVLALSTNDQWVVARDPIHPKQGRTEPGAGSGIPFALEMLKADTNITIGLVPCAVGGTSLNRWGKGADLYETAVRRARLAAQTGVIPSVLWHQGESDTTSRKNAETYEVRLIKMFQDLRNDLGQTNLPIVVGQLGNFLEPEKYPYAQTVRDSIKHIPVDLPDVGYADSAGLGDKGDKLHFSADAANELGRRYARAMHKLEAVSSYTVSDAKTIELSPAEKMPECGAREAEALGTPDRIDAKRISILDFGAVGDGLTLNTKSIESAIDRIAANGGGTIVVPAGVFVSGAIFFKPGVRLHLEKGAVLRCSTDLKNFSQQRT